MTPRIRPTSAHSRMAMLMTAAPSRMKMRTLLSCDHSRRKKPGIVWQCKRQRCDGLLARRCCGSLGWMVPPALSGCPLLFSLPQGQTDGDNVWRSRDNRGKSGNTDSLGGLEWSK